MSLLKDIEPIKTKDYLRTKFQEYYQTAEITLPPRFTSREWGFLDWNGRGMRRHVKFNSFNEVKKYLQKNTPAHCYHSVAYYEDPGKMSMVEKDWKGADLIFDLDADHLPEMQDVIGGKITFAQLMEYIKEQTSRLVNDVLLGNFGLNENELMIVFSGGRGYHVHVRNPDVLTLPSGARREIADYLTGKGLDLNKILIDAGYTKEYPIRGKGLERKNIPFSKLPKDDSKGWQGIISKFINEKLDKLREMEKEERKKEIKDIGIPKDVLNLKDNNDEAFNNIPEFAKKNFVKFALKETAIHPDEPVTGDIHRLIRLPGSLHGKTGLVVKTLSRKELDNFDPYEIPIAFGEKPVKVRNVVGRPVTMGNNHKLNIDEIKELPEFVAIYFMAMKFATLCLEK